MKTVSVRKSHSAVGTIVVAVIVVIIVAAAGVGTFLVLNRSGTTSPAQASSSSSPTSTTTPSSSQSSSTSSSSPGVSTSSSQSNPTFSVIGNIKDLIGNFSQMEISFSLINGSTSESGNYSYFTVGHPTISGTPLTEVNLTVTESGAHGLRTTALLYFDSTGNVTLATLGGINYTGPEASIAGFMVLPFTIMFSESHNIFGNLSVYSNLVSTGTSTETYGSLTLPVTSYHATNFAVGNVTISSITVKIGTPPGTHFSLLTYVQATGTSSNGVSHGSYTLELISATQG